MFMTFLFLGWSFCKNKGSKPVNESGSYLDAQNLQTKKPLWAFASQPGMNIAAIKTFCCLNSEGLASFPEERPESIRSIVSQVS